MIRMKTFFKKAVLLLLSFAIILPASLMIIGDSGFAHAVTSLPYIETLKQAGGIYNVLEIVPKAGEGSIGYYIDGQEPCADWVQKTALIVGKSNRITEANRRLNELVDAGLMGSGNAAPLEKIGDYAEAYPWEPHEGYTALSLATPDKIELTGAFSEASDNNGAFKLTSDFEFDSAGNGSYNQRIDYFTTNPSLQKGDLYFYSPTFKKISDTYQSETDIPGGTPIYSLDSGKNIYVYEGTVGSANFPGMEIGETYYYVSDIGAPTEPGAGGAAPDVTHIYAAVSSSYKSVGIGEKGYFNASDISFEYVGTGGTHVYSPNGGTPGVTHKVRCKTVFYTGGFSNNNWFLKYVFDWDGKAETMPNLVLKVKSMVGNSITENDVSTASLLVASKGFNPGGAATVYNGTNDISSDVRAAILDAVEKSDDNDKRFNLPVIVDNGLSSSAASNLRGLASSLRGSRSWDSYALNSVYFFSADTSRKALATAAFNRSYTSSQYTSENSPFFPVYSEIQYENFLRTQENPNTADKLTESVSMAGAIRYIINFGGQRNITIKNDITVLEIQPGTGSEIDAKTVRGWLGIAKEADMKVTIVTMSTAEFVGKIENLVETYDMIYIGSSVKGFNTAVSGGETIARYNDIAMNGLLYSNIGDKYLGGYVLSGLLDRDFATGSTFSQGGTTYNKINANDATRTFRFSGNDLSNDKVKELQNFASAGYPIIVADKLIAGSVGDVVFTAAITADISGDNVTLTAKATAISGTLPAGLSYQWYRNGAAISGATGSTYVFAPGNNSEAKYLCKITASGETAVSNTITIKKGSSSGASFELQEPPVNEAGSYYDYDSRSYSYTTTLDAYPKNNVHRYDDVTLTANVSLKSGGTFPAGTVFVYRWYRSNTLIDTQTTTNITQATTTFKTVGIYFQYQCRVEVQIPNPDFGSSRESKSNYVISEYLNKDDDKVSVANYGDEDGSYSMKVRKTYSVTTDAYQQPNNLVYITVIPDEYSHPSTYNYKWYKNNVLIKDSIDWECTVGYPSSGEDVYWCVITKLGYTNISSARSNNIIVRASSSGITQTNDESTKEEAVIRSDKEISVNTTRVDFASNMYTALNSITAKPNVMPVSNAEKENETLLKFLNLSKPEILWQEAEDGSTEGSYPTKYQMDSAGNITGMEPVGGKYALTFKFTIKNDTDATPLTTTYDCRLYMGGLNKEGEQLSDIVVRNTRTNALILPDAEGKYNLKADIGYTVTREMPEGYVGILPWKLEISKNGVAEYVHASQNNYTHIKGAAEKIYILQIMSKDGSGMNLKTDQTYSRLLSQVKDFNVDIATTTANNLNDPSKWTVTRDRVTTTYRTLKEYFAAFDMLVLGFEDAYREISDKAAEAILEFSKEGSVLFTHDTTSIVNLPFNKYPTNSGATTVNQPDNYFWGYSFNKILRSVVGLDRYGVTDSEWGRTTKYLASSGAGNPVVAGPLSEANATLVKAAGYSVAYAPVSTNTPKLTTIQDVQGYTKYIPVRYTSNSSQLRPTSGGSYNTSAGNNSTTVVSQVNEGQITTYPFNLNTLGFDNAPASAKKTISVASTHEQYYQLNLNSDDIVVWYCLAGEPFDQMPNDVVNSYYIFSKGNITYSGAGHSGGTVTEEEAKLFINTMIAAYKVALVNPEVSFTDSGGTNELTSYLIPGDSEGLLTQGSAENIYFTATDSNINRDKKITASFSYTINGIESLLRDLKIYSPQSDKPVNETSNYTLTSGRTYYVKLSELIAALKDKGIEIGSGGLELSVKVTTDIAGSKRESKVAAVTLRQLNLFGLN